MDTSQHTHPPCCAVDEVYVLATACCNGAVRAPGQVLKDLALGQGQVHLEDGLGVLLVTAQHSTAQHGTAHSMAHHSAHITAHTMAHTMSDFKQRSTAT
jgi:hypothetical protein